MTLKSHQGADLDGSITDLFWILIGLLCITTAMIRGGGRSIFAGPQVESQSSDPSADAKAERSRAKAQLLNQQADKNLTTYPEQGNASISILDQGGIMDRLIPQAHARRVIFLLDDRPDTARVSTSGEHYLKLAAKKAREILMGCHHAEEATLISLGGIVARYTTRSPSTPEGDSIEAGIPTEQVVEFCRQIEQTSTSATFDDLPAAFVRVTSGLSLDDNEVVVVVLAFDKTVAGPVPPPERWNHAAPVHVFLFGPSSPSSLLRWALRLARAAGSVSVAG